MTPPNPQPRPRLYNGDLEPRGHAAAYIVVLLLLVLAGVLFAMSSGWLTVPSLSLSLPARNAQTMPPRLVLPTATADPGAVAAGPAPAAQLALVAASDWDTADGHFFTQTNGQESQTSAKGYAVSNANGVPLWNAYRDLGGADFLGYPLSRRFDWRGFPTQVFQKSVMQWRPDTRQVEFVNLFDELSAAGKDEWLFSERAVPRPLRPDFGQGRNWEQTVAAHLALLEANPAFKASYFAVPDPLRLYGLPVSPVTDMGNHYAMRFQRAVFQHWKTDMPWARQGQVTIANVGAIAIEAGLFPPEAVVPEEAPAGSAPLAVGRTTPATPAAASTPTALPTPAGNSMLVGNTGGAGVYLRRTPRLDDKLVAWPDNARMLLLGEEIQAGGIRWLRVKDPAGNEGWIPAPYLVPPRQ